MDDVPEVIAEDVLTVKAAFGDNLKAAAAFQRVISYYASVRHLDDERRRAIEQNLTRYVNEQLAKAMKPVQKAVQNMWNHSELLATEETVKDTSRAISEALVETLNHVQARINLMSSRTEGVAYALDEIEERLRGMGAKIKKRKTKPITLLGKLLDKEKDEDGNG